MSTSKGILFLATAISLLLTNCSFSEVDPGRYYRSPQLNGKQLDEAHQRYQFKTIINLRGYNKGKSWYDVESEFAKNNNITLIDIPMSAKTIPSRKNLIKLLDALKTAERPILLHCQAGVDRTGEASVIYAMSYMGQSKDQAKEMLSSKYGYTDGISPAAKRYFIDNIWVDEAWARENYYPCKNDYKYFNKDQCDENGDERLMAVEPDDEYPVEYPVELPFEYSAE